MKFNRLISPAKSTPPGVKGMPARDRPEQLEPLLLMSASAHDFDFAEDINPDELSTVASGLDAGAAEALTEFATLSDMDLFDLAAIGCPGQLTTDIADRNSDIADVNVEPVPDTEPLREVVFIDSNTPDLNALLADLQNESDPNREFIAILLDADRSGIDQITAALSNLHNVAAMHVVSHGSEGRVELGNEILDVGTVSNHLKAIESWANALTSDADILIYGCDLAAADSGRALMQIIAEASGGDVAASDDATGAETQGGDWILEEQVGNVSTKVAFSEELWNLWDHILANYTGTEGADVIAATNGNDSIDGLGGIDTVVYSGNYAEYVISGNPDKIIDDQTPGRDGTDTLTNIERAEFLDGLYDLTNHTFSPFVAPSLTISGLTLTYTEDSGPIAIDDQLTISDADSATLNSATVRITGNYNSTQDLLSFTNQSGISGAWDSSTGTLTLTGSASVADYEAALRSVTYSNNSNAPSTSNRTISITATDAQLTSVAATRTIAVVATNDTPVGLPAITGFVREDQTLTADVSGLADIDGLGTISYQWLRNGASISGATNSTYTSTDADVGAAISVRVRYTDGHGTLESLTSSSTDAITGINDTPVGLPVIQGTIRENQTLTANTSAINDADGLGAFSYQWLRNGSAISGATDSNYATEDADVGTNLSVQISYTDNQGTTETLTSVSTTAVQNVNDLPIGLPVLSGVFQEDQTLTANVAGISDIEGLGPFNYQWLRNGSAISGATSANYSTTDADVGTRISVRVSFVDGLETTETLTSAQSSTIAAINDAPTGLPTISGTLEEDRPLTVNVSGINDADGLNAFSYQWLRNGAVISGATAANYTPRDADVGTQLSVQVSWTDDQGFQESLTSAVSSPVANINDTPTGRPTVSGSALEDQTLQAVVDGISDIDGLGTLQYQWLRDDQDISEANSSNYQLVDADVDARISLRVSWTDGYGTTESVTSLKSSEVVNINDTPVGEPVIVGIATEDQVLTADVSSLSDGDGLGTFRYQWLCDGVNISGATASTYRPTDADVNSRISVEVSYTDGHGLDEVLTSNETTRIAAINDTPVGLPEVSGLLVEDQTLTAQVNTVSDADGIGSIRYQWLRNGSEISGATSATYTTGDSDVGTQLSVVIRYTDAQGTQETLTSVPTAAIENVNDEVTGRPEIQGNAVEDQFLTARTSSLADNDGLGAFQYQWLRDGLAISGATNDSYRLSDADVNAQILLQVTYTDALGSTEVITSGATDAVENINDTLTGQIFLVGNAEQNSTLTVDSSGLRDDDGLGTLQYRWYRDGEEIAGATSASYTLVENDVNTRISTKVEYTDDHGTAESANSDSTGRVLNVNDNPVGLPSITGITTEDQTLTANTDGIRDDDGAGEYRLQWLRDGVAVDGADDATYRLRDEDVGGVISLRVTYTDGHGKIEQLDSAAMAAIASVEDAPSVTIVSNQQIDQLRGTGSLQFQVFDVDTQSRFLIVTATSSDLNVVPIENIVLGGIGQFRTIEILPTSTDTQAQTVITVTVSDGTTSTTMSFTVTARGVLTPNNNNGNGRGNSGKGNGNGPSYARGNEVNQDEVDALIHANSDKDQKTSSDDDSVQEQKVESERDKNFSERPKETTVQTGESNCDEAAAPGQQPDSESQNETVIRTADSATPPAAPREAGSQSPDVILTGVDELSLVPNEVHSAAPTDVEIAVEQSLTADSIEDASSAVLTSVVAVGAMSAIGKGSAVGVLGTSTTTNTYLYVTSKGQLAAAKTFETIVGHMSNLGGTTASGALMAQQIQSSGAISSGVVTGSSAALATIASQIPIWYSFDPITILDRFATEYAPLDAAENSGLLSLFSKPV
ncbi:MAG: DUF4347 domain-containing protein [Planctomycetales bacterium]|nr:DUF4347 domain-containing protein [Planctomycetales bacterium]